MSRMGESPGWAWAMDGECDLKAVMLWWRVWQEVSQKDSSGGVNWWHCSSSLLMPCPFGVELWGIWESSREVGEQKSKHFLKPIHPECEWLCHFSEVIWERNIGWGNPVIKGWFPVLRTFSSHCGYGRTNNIFKRNISGNTSACTI